MKHQLTDNGGKGSAPRSVNRDKFNENFDRIFGKKEASSLEDQIFAMYDEGKTPTQIARELNESPFVVRQILRGRKHERR